MTLNFPGLSLIPLLAAVVCGAMSVAGAFASERDSGGPDGFERERVYSVPVQGADGPGFEIDRVVVNVGDRLVGISTGAGVVRESQNKVRLRGVPVLGQIFADRLSVSDFVPEKMVGEAFVEDRNLFVDLSQGRRGLWFDTVLLVHGKFSYRLQGNISGGGSLPTGSPRHVGTAYARESTLVVLIRPSVITDSLF